MDGLPKLPGFEFTNIKLQHHVPHCFDYKNGYLVPLQTRSSTGNEPLPNTSVNCVKNESAVLYDPVLTYGRLKKSPVEPFRPYYVVFDKITLTFFGFFKQSVTESQKESYRVRYVKIIYFLEDNSMTVIEPHVRNCGIVQGRIVRRAKIPKNVIGETYSWKDLNIGIDIELNGIVFHIYDCDPFTKDFLESQGIELNPTECRAIDPYSKEEEIKKVESILETKNPNKKKTDDDKMRRFLEFCGKVLRFDCILDETDREAGEGITYKMYYFLEDDTVAISELKENREGRDRFPMFLKRTKVPTNWRRRPSTYPAVYMERGPEEVDEFYQPKHFRIGDTIFVYGRKFLLLDCDKFTRTYFANVLKNPQPEKLIIKLPEREIRKLPIPDYLGLGTPEDSLASCFGLYPKRPKKNVIKFLLNNNRYLRYSAVLDSAHPEDHKRKFIISFSLADDSIKINEPPVRNSGIIAGKFLAQTRVKIPGCDPKSPIYYGPPDFYIGAILRIKDHRFRIVGCDLYVYRYMQEYSERFTKEAILSVQKYLLLEGNLKDDIREAIQKDFDSSDETKKPKEEKCTEGTQLEDCVEKLNIHKTIEVPGGLDTVQPEFNVTAEGERGDACKYKIKPLASEAIQKQYEKTAKDS